MTTTSTDHISEADEDAPQRPRRWAVRRPRNRLLTGLASGLGDHWGIPTPYVRAGFVVATFASGAGIVAYLVGWLFTLERDEDTRKPDPTTPNQKVGIGLIFVGALVALRGFGLWFTDEIVFGAALLAFGIAVMWDRSDPEARNRLARLSGAGEEDVTRIRVIGGGLLMLAGFAAFIASIDAFSDVGPALIAVAMTVVGFMIVFGPLVWRLARDLADERRSRIRSEEKADMAAHLHDSVLQTLALIQRTDDPKRMVTLARGQERELREWLYARRESEAPDDVATAIRDQAARVESTHDIPIDVVIVGADAPLTPALAALAQAAGEAMTNAAKHSGATKISVFVEISDQQAEVYVSDSGTGFDPASIDPARRGITESIIGRMNRHGGTAEITTADGDGTEVRLVMERT